MDESFYNLGAIESWGRVCEVFIWCSFCRTIIQEVYELQYAEEGKINWLFECVSFTIHVYKFDNVFHFSILLSVFPIAEDPAAIELAYASRQHPTLDVECNETIEITDKDEATLPTQGKVDTFLEKNRKLLFSL